MKKVVISLLMICCATATSPSPASSDNQWRPKTSNRSSGVSSSSDLGDQYIARSSVETKKLKKDRVGDRASDRLRLTEESQSGYEAAAAKPVRKRSAVHFQNQDDLLKSSLRKSSRFSSADSVPRLPHLRGSAAADTAAGPEGKSHADRQKERQYRITEAARERIKAIEAADRKYDAAIEAASRP